MRLSKNTFRLRALRRIHAARALLRSALTAPWPWRHPGCMASSTHSVRPAQALGPADGILPSASHRLSFPSRRIKRCYPRTTADDSQESLRVVRTTRSVVRGRSVLGFRPCAGFQNNGKGRVKRVPSVAFVGCSTLTASYTSRAWAGSAPAPPAAGRPAARPTRPCRLPRCAGGR